MKADGTKKSMASNNAQSSSNPSISKGGKGFGALVDQVEQGKPTTSGSVFQKPLPGGTSVTIKKQKTLTQTCPLSGLIEDGKFAFTRAGTIGGIIPSNLITGVGGALLKLTLGSGWNYIHANVQSLNGLVQSVTIATQTTPLDPIGETEGLPPTSFKLPLYAVYNEGETNRAIRMFGCGNISISALKVLSYAKDEISCGEYPLIDVWTWQTTLAA